MKLASIRNIACIESSLDLFWAALIPGEVIIRATRAILSNFKS